MTENTSVPKTELTTSEKRQSGPELLRIFAILLITCVHLLNYGGFLENAASETELLLLRLLYSLFTVSVNIFVIISGYFLVNSSFRIKKLVRLWGTVVFYAITLYFLSLLIFGDAWNGKEFISCLFPVIHREYWFFTAYFLLYQTSPLLNKILKNSDRKTLLVTLIGIFVLSYFARRFRIDEVVSLHTGYNLIWFICLYLTGGILKLLSPRIKKRYLLAGFLFCILWVWSNFYYKEEMPLYKYLYNSPDYTSFIVFTASVLIFLFFARLEIRSKLCNRLILCISSASFGVYLLQEAIMIKPHIYFEVFRVQQHYGKTSSFLFVLLFALGFYLLGFVYEQIRRVLLQLCYWSVKKLKAKSNKI